MVRLLWTVLRPVAVVCAVGLLAACTSASGQNGANLTGGGAAGVTTVVLTPTTLSGAPATSSALQGAGLVLAKRFAGVGLPTPSFTVTSDGKLSLKVSADVPRDEIEALVAPDVLTIRPVVATAQASTGRQFPGDTTAPGDDATLLAQAKTQVGAAAYTLAASLTRTPTDQASLATLAPFGGLTPNLVAVLPPSVQFYVPTISCTQLDARDPYYLAADRFDDRQIVACDATGANVKYLLGPAKLVGSDVASAAASADPAHISAGWVVTVQFTASGQQKWADFTDAEFESQIAMVVGDLVVSAPVIQAQILGPAVISGGNVSQQYAEQLANVLNAGALSVAFTVSQYSTSP